MLDSRDLRSGMSLIAAGLAADGHTRVLPLETVERGYSQLVERLHALGVRTLWLDGPGGTPRAVSAAVASPVQQRRIRPA